MLKGTKVVAILVGFFLQGSPALAQEDRFEVFGGLSYITSEHQESAFGWNASLGWQFREWLALSGDVAGHYDERNRTGAEIDTMLHTFFLGPQVSLQIGKFRPFVRGMLGLIRTDSEIFFADHDHRQERGGNRFGYALGGGVDLNVSETIALRLIQVDSIAPIRDNISLNNRIRLSTGLVVAF